MKIHLYKFLLSLVRGLVLLKRAIVWFAQVFGRFFIWVFKPTVPFLMVPLYNTMRRTARKYNELGETVSERRMRVLLSEPAAIFFIACAMVLMSHAASVASSTSGAIAGAHSILYTRLLSKGTSDWQSDETVATDNEPSASQSPDVVFQGGGAVATVFPYGGMVGKSVNAPESQTQPVEKTAPPPIQSYTVRSGDSIAKIASKFHIKQETLLAANSLQASAIVHVKDVLSVPSVDGVLYTVVNGGTTKDVARKFGVQPLAIALANNIGAADALTKGQILIVPGVTPVLPHVSKPAQKVAPAPVQKQIAAAPQPADVQAPEPPPATGSGDVVNTDELVVQPTTTKVTPHPPLAPGEKLLWPTVGHTLTQYFSGYHPGDDIDGDYTSKIFAAADGTVVASGWNDSGYGNMILIDHGNGMETRYGHCSKVFVSIGQEVHRGDVIGMIGTTGRSTGTHLHFEVIIGGRRVNPLKYIR